MEPASGAQFELRAGNLRLVVVEVGGGLRECEFAGQPILDGFAMDRMADGARGQPLLPWPNRLADGRYDFDGQQLQLPIDETSRNNASHGLTRWLNWRLLEQSTNRVRLEHVLHPRPGYPFTLALQVEYTLRENGFSVTTTARNRGSHSLPFGAGQHPYFTVGTPLVDTAVLHVPARHRLEVDAQRRLPTGRVLPTSGSYADFHEPRAIGQAQLDECYCELERDPDNFVRAHLINPATGRRLTVWADQHYRYLQVFTGDTLAAERRRRGLAIEPLTCPPNAFRTRTDVIVLEPDASVRLEWGVDLTLG